MSDYTFRTFVTYKVNYSPRMVHNVPCLFFSLCQRVSTLSHKKKVFLKKKKSFQTFRYTAVIRGGKDAHTGGII